MKVFSWNFSNGDILKGISCNDKDTVPVFFNRNELIGNCVIEKTGNQTIGHFKLSLELENDTYLVATSSSNLFDQVPRELYLEAFLLIIQKNVIRWCWMFQKNNESFNNKFKVKKLLLSLIAIITIVTTIQAQTYIAGGSVSGLWKKAASPYVVQGSIIVPSGQTLTIEPGVKVLVQSKCKLYIQGRLIALGNITDTISFSAYDISSPWNGIKFENIALSNDTSKISFCKISYSSSTGTDVNGGGVYINNSPKISFSNSLISNCSASNNGGGIYINSIPIINISNCKFINNICGQNGGGNGGGISLENINSMGAISNSLISDNLAYGAGGGLNINNGCWKIKIENDTISFNSSRGLGYGNCNGGGIGCIGNTTIQNNYITNNYSDGDGGGIFGITNVSVINNKILYNSGVSGGGFAGNAAISGNIISYNTSKSAGLPGGGGGVYLVNENASLQNNIISNNNSLSIGGGIAIIGCNQDYSIYNNVITNNSASGDGGAVYLFSYCSTISPTFVNNTISNNSAAGNGGAFYLNNASPNFSNCIIWGNRSSLNGNQFYNLDQASQPNFYFSNVQGATSAFETNGNFYLGAFQNCIDSNPQFISPTIGAGSAFDFSNANWTLRNLSPCINSGNPIGSYPETDIVGNKRIIDTIDIGAYEFNSFPPTITKHSEYVGCNSVIFKGYAYAASTTLRDTIKSIQGYDSIYNVYDILVNTIKPTTFQTSIIGCNSIFYNKKIFTSSTILIDTVKSYQGCDSIYNLTNIIINSIKPVTRNLNYTNCSNVTYNGINYTSSTKFIDTIRSYQGCDSIYNVLLITINNIVPTRKISSIRNCDSIFYNDKLYTNSTSLVDTIRSYQGCDSIYLTTQIIIDKITPTKRTSNISGCNSIFYKGRLYTNSTSIVETIMSYQGCDSIYLTTFISINKINTVTKSITLTGCNSLVYQSKTYTKSTTVRDTVRSYQGCDSIYNVAEIKVNPLPKVRISGDNVLKGDSTILTATIDNAAGSGNFRYIKFTSTYSADNGQVNVYEIQAFKNGINIALNKPGYANSYQGGASWSYSAVNDGDNNSRWSSDRNNPGNASVATPIYVVVDLQQVFSLDSVVLNIAGLDNWQQTFTLQVSTDTINWTTIGSGTNVTGIFTYPLVTNSLLWNTGSTNQSIVVRSAGIYSVKATDINGCSSVAFDTVTSILPVTISSFNAAANNKIIKTDWQTATELNASHFNIQRRADGNSFTNIGTIKAVGTGANSYEFTDKNPVTGTNYYRLQNVDKDGKFSYSKVVTVQFSANNKPLTIYPNPVTNSLTISGKHIVGVQVIDNMGKIVAVKSFKDATNPQLSVQSLNAGVYHLRIGTIDGGTTNVGFIKQ